MNGDRWLNCRLVDLRRALAQRGYQVSEPVISRLLAGQGYRLRRNVKGLSTHQHPDRDLQFQYIRAQRQRHQAAQQPVISVDTKKKELIGNFRNPGQTWGRRAEVVDAHDFPQDALGRAVPYGIYDLSHNCGTVYVGQSADTPLFAVESIAHWWENEGRVRFPEARQLLIEADAGGSNAARSRMWKHQLQQLVADRFGLTVTVCHYPTGASKWNPVEHRLFSEISKTWAGVPLRTFELVLHLIGQTTTQTGLSVRAHLITTCYTKGLKVSDAQMAALDCRPHAICPHWNYSLHPRLQPSPGPLAELISL